MKFLHTTIRLAYFTLDSFTSLRSSNPLTIASIFVSNSRDFLHAFVMFMAVKVFWKEVREVYRSEYRPLLYIIHGNCSCKGHTSLYQVAEKWRLSEQEVLTYQYY